MAEGMAMGCTWEDSVGWNREEKGRRGRKERVEAE